MPKLIIDNIEIEVSKGTKVIEAAERLGIMIPRFCYHEALGSVGACRMCAVKFLQGPFKGVQMSCMIEARDGMVVSTTDEEAVEFRKSVIEWLMLNHPHDCPVCDEGGQCLLQDMTVSGGHSIRRYLGKKRTYRDQYLGPLIQHEMNRCIHCYRCSRFYQEYAGYRDLGVMQIGSRVFFGRYNDGDLESPFSGNLADICPTGVYTDKPARFKARRWDLERSPSVCTHCSLGCNTVANTRYRAVIRVEARVNKAVNGHFICDLGRFGFPYADHPGRPRRPRVDTQEVPWDEAVRSGAQRLETMLRDGGPQSFAALGSTRSSLEAQAMLRRFCGMVGSGAPAFFIDPALEAKVKRAVSRLDAGLAVSMAEIEKADFVLAAGVDPINEAPMLALAMRQARRNGACVAVIDPRPVLLPFEFDHLPVPLGGVERCLSLLAGKAVSRENAEKLGTEAFALPDSPSGADDLDSGTVDRIGMLGSKLSGSLRPVIVCGTDIVRETTPDLAADLARLLRAAKGQCGLFHVFPGPNALGAALCGGTGGRSFMDVVEEIESGVVTGLLVVESDPFHHFPDEERLEKALNKLGLLIVLDHLPSSMACRATIFLPTLNPFETGSTYINQEGRIQFAAPVHAGGIPICQETGGDHPPREYGREIPGRDQKPAWQGLMHLARAMSLPMESASGDDVGGPLKWIAGEVSALRELGELSYPVDGVRALGPVGPSGSGSSGSSDGQAREREHMAVKMTPEPIPPEGHLRLLLVGWTFGTEELSSYSRVIQQVEKEPYACMHPDDADIVGLSDGDRICIPMEKGAVQLPLRLTNRMARGILIVPRHRQIPWQRFGSFTPTIDPACIKKLGSSRINVKVNE